MADVRFLYVQKSDSEIEQMYKDADIIQYCDFVFQKTSNNTAKIYMNGQWVKSMYNSKISNNTEIEDDVYLLSSSINDVSTRLSEKYITTDIYEQDEQLIAATLTNFENRLNNVISNDEVETIKTSINTISDKTEKLENKFNGIEWLNKTDINGTIDSYKEVENFLSNISDSSTLTDILLTQKNDIINTDQLTNYYTKQIIDNISTNINDIFVKLDNTSINLNDVSNRLKETDDKLQNYVTTETYLSDEQLTTATFADINNRINELQKQIQELKDSKTTD